MGQHINTFIGGMDKDTSKHKYSNTKYVDANNIRPLTDEGLSSGALENIDGNKFVIDFKEILGMSVIDITGAANDENNTTKTINNFFIDTGYSQTSISSSNITFTNSTELLEKLTQLIEEKNQQLPLQLQYKIGILNSIDRIAIYNFATPIQSISTDVYHIPQIFSTTRDFIVIGSAELRNDIILFTKNQTGPRDFGQIWRLSYDVARPEDPSYYSLTLIYNGAVNFSLEHPIEAKARYENAETERVYWTDYNNTLRGCNISDPNIFAFREQEFSLVPETELSPAIAGRKNHTNGNLDSGIWYTTYRLSRIGGSVTGIAPFSEGIPVIVDDPSVGVGGNDTDYHLTNYAITSVPTTKSIDFKVFDIPKGHDQLTLYAIHEPEPGNFIAYLYDEYFLSDAEDFEFTLTDTSIKEVIPFTSLIDVNVEFDKVKTITIKDNSLLVGNCSVAAFNIDFDARVYRFRNTQAKQTYVGIGPGNTLTAGQLSENDWGIPKESSAINPYNNDITIEEMIASGSTFQSLDYSYQIDGITKGGTGPNISYEFVSTQFIMDNSAAALPTPLNLGVPSTNPANDKQNVNYNSTAPFVNNVAEDNVDVNINGKNIDIGPGFSNFKNPTFEAYFKGYMRDEVYRFGIVFYSKTGRASEVKWIGDIRFPSAGDGEVLDNGFNPLSLGQYTSNVQISPNQPPAGENCGNGAQIPATETGGTYGHTIGIKFNVDVSSIRDDISGYSIVRAPRKEKDRTIIAEGVMHTIEKRRRPFAPVIGSPVGLNNNLIEGSWKGVQISQNDLYIKDSIKDSSKAHEDYAPNISSSPSGFNYSNSNRETKWEFGTIDCPDLKMITGAKLNGFKDKLQNSTDPVNDYRIKPVALYSESYDPIDGIDFNKDVTVNGRIRDFYVWNPIDKDLAEDIYSKSTVLINSTSSFERYRVSREFGSLKDMFFVDHGNGADSYAEIKDFQGTDRRFFNAGIRDVAGPTSSGGILSSEIQQQTFGGIGTRTILFQGHDYLLAKRIINAAGGLTATDTKDPYSFESPSTTPNFFTNNLHNWGYIGRFPNKFHRGMYAVVDIYRPLESQYGGNTYLARQETEYITTGNFVKINSDTSGIDIISSETVYGGDINTTLWTEKKFYTYESDNTSPWAGTVQGPYRIEKGGIRGMIVPMQTIANTELRPLIHLNNYNSPEVSTTDIRTHRGNPDEYAIPIVFHKENDIQSYLVEGAGTNLINEYDNRVYMSNTKNNGEVLDSWSIFEALKYKDVNGEYGPINKLETFNDNVVFFQDKAFGSLAVNPRSVIQDTGGNDLTFGVGGGIVDFNYISNSIGSTHQWGIQKAKTGIYFFDSLHKKMFMFGGQASPISDIKGMSSWFYNKILGNSISSDNPILFEGITTAYDQRFNEVIFTFHFYTDEITTPEAVETIEDLLAGITESDVSNVSNMTNVNSGLANIIGQQDPSIITTFPESATRIYYTPYMQGLDLYKIAISNTILTQVQAQLNSGSKLFMTVPNGNYVEVTIDTNYNIVDPGFIYVTSPEMSLWQNELSPKIDWKPIGFKCTKQRLLDLEEVPDTKPVDDITSITVSDSIITSEVDANPRPDARISYTIVYNELTQAFTSFYSHYPRHYFTNSRRVFSQDPKGTDLYVHDEGNKGQFYGEMFDTDVELMISPPGNHTKVFNNFEFNSQVYDNIGANLTDVTIDKARFFNEYQDSQTILFEPNVNIKRRMRTWRLQIPRDSDTRRSRIRNPYMNTKVTFTNTANRRIVLHDTTTHYMDTPM